MPSDEAGDWDDPAFVAFVTAYQEALADGRPLPNASHLDPAQQRRWARLRGLMHLLHRVAKRPSRPPPPGEGPAPG
jgi:hypothetical protein